MSEFEELYLIQKSKKGDRSAFGQIVLNYSEYIYSIVFRIVNNEAEVEDVAQEVFIQAWQRLKYFDENKAKFSTWLYTIATRKAIDVYRKTRREVKVNVDESITDICNTEQRLANKDMLNLIERATVDLSEVQRVVLILRDFEDLNVQEVVQITGYSEKKIKDNLYVARQKIRKRLKKHLIAE